jgi:hypothetical protein
MTDYKIRKIVRAGGAEYCGFTADTGFVWLRDPRTGTSRVIPLADLTVEAVRAKLAEIRAQYSRRPPPKRGLAAPPRTPPPNRSTASWDAKAAARPCTSPPSLK